LSPLHWRDVAPDELDAPFWRGCREHRFLVHRCTVCDRAYWPASTCVDHGSSSMEWQPASGLGAVHTYTVVHHPYDRSLEVPYVVAVVKLDEGPFFHSDIVGCDPSHVHVGMRVRVTYENIDDETTLPHFAPSADTDAAPSADAGVASEDTP
jgi:uncharacterized OB-fold protein